MSELTVLLVASEAGGARNLIPILKFCSGNHGFCVVAKRGAIPLFVEAGVGIQLDVSISSVEDALQILDKIKANVLLCGRGIRQDSVERLFTVAARIRKIASVGIVDEWYDYRANYCDITGTLTHLPDVVCCPDKDAFNEAIADGLPENVLRVTGSPALATLYNKKEEYERHPPPRPHIFNSSGNSINILFISEELSISDSRSVELDNESQYNNDMLRRELACLLSERFGYCSVIEKQHPSMEIVSKTEIMLNGVRWTRVRDVELHALLWWSDLIIGISSMALMEAAMLSRPTVSYQPESVEGSHCTAVRKQMITRCTNQKELKNWLVDYGRKAYSLDHRPEYACKDSIASIFSIINEKRNLFDN